MKLDSRQTVLIGFAIAVLLLSVTVAAADETEYQVESTNVQIYRDGLVRVTQTLTVNETIAAVTVPLLNSSSDNFIVLDENQTVLDYEVDANNLTILTLGATEVTLQYDTHSLTMKHGELWTFIVDTPYNITVQLPDASTVVYLSETPTAINMEDNQITLFPSQWEISYVFPLNPPAEFQLSDLTVTPLEVKAGEKVTVSVKVTNVGGQSGSYAVSLMINQTIDDTKTVILEKGASTTTEFNVVKQTPATYIIEIAGLTSKFTVTAESSNGGGSSNGFPIEYVVVALVAVAVVLVAVFFFVKKRRPDAEKIVKLHPHLNKEEQDVIQFLAENDGKAFESQIRERFPGIPRTSLWRLVRRLEKLGIVKVKKIGLENQVELKK